MAYRNHRTVHINYSFWYESSQLCIQESLVYIGYARTMTQSIHLEKKHKFKKYTAF
jgi:hypothetical protein